MTADWEMVTARPAPDLLGAVTGYAGYRETRPLALTRREVATTVVPLIVNFGAPFAMTMANGDTVAPAGFAAGIIDQPVLVCSTGAAACVQVDFTISGAYRFFQCDPREMAGRIVALDGLGGFAGLAERLAEAASWPQRFALFDGLIRTRLQRGRQLSPEIAGALTLLRHGRRRIRDIAVEIGWSERHLARRFTAETGVAPKTIARILRFERARGLAAGAPHHDWAGIALAAGYADQAHLVREFTALSGLPPGRLSARDTGAGGILEPA